tara:strand:- start:825 stop:1043 length:219 start_codon:yes stop_codon:yes gene_type:complete
MLGVFLDSEDLLAIERLYNLRWRAEIKNWKEKGCDDCMWTVTTPNETNYIISERGPKLAPVIDRILEKCFLD